MFKQGLVLGKFMPLHKGHLALIDFASRQCRELIVLLCVHEGEEIPASVRMQWLSDVYSSRPAIKLAVYEYNPQELTNQSVSGREESHRWGKTLHQLFPEVDAFFTSEAYGDVVAEVWPVQHVSFNPERSLVAISGTMIREKPFRYWDYLPTAVQPWFVRKIVLTGTESTGKTVFSKQLAEHFSTNYVSEAARGIVEVTEQCTEANLEQIAIAHAQAIHRQERAANKVLFLDTDVMITRSYSHYLFQKELYVPEWIEEANKAHVYLFLEHDAPYVQDGTRLPLEERNILSVYHRRELEKRNIPYVSISGNSWDSRFERAKEVVNEFITLLS